MRYSIEKMSTMSKAVGKDVGIVKCLHNSESTTPSIVFFGPNGVLVGDKALEKKKQSKNIIYESEE